MLQEQSFYEGHSFHEGRTWRSIRERIGEGLRERCEVPKELPSKFLALLRKLDAIEGKYLLRYAPPLERRSAGENDWLPPRFVWQHDLDLFGG
jgi:hypothetical protein